MDDSARARSVPVRHSIGAVYGGEGNEAVAGVIRATVSGLIERGDLPRVAVSNAIGVRCEDVEELLKAISACQASSPLRGVFPSC